MNQDKHCVGESKPGLQAWFVVALAACTQAVSQVEQAVVGLAAEPIRGPRDFASKYCKSL